MIKKLIILLFVLISAIFDKSTCLCAEEVKWPFKLRYHSNIYNENDNSLKGSDYYEALIELCKTNYYGNKLRRLAVDASFEWIEHFLGVDKLPAKTIDVPYSLKDSLYFKFSDEDNPELSIHRKSLENPTYQMWDFIGNDYSRYRVVNFLATGMAFGYVCMEMFGDNDIENISFEIYVNLIIPDNIGRSEDLDWDSILKILRFKSVFNIDQYLENQKNTDYNSEFQEQCDCESLRVWNLKEVEIEGEKIRLTDFLHCKDTHRNQNNTNNTITGR